MGAQGEALASKLDQVTSQLTQAIEKCPDADWTGKKGAEGWPVGVTAHHAATSYDGIVGLVQAVATGQGMPPLTMEMIDAGNAQHAQQAAGCTKQETLEALRAGSQKAGGILRGLSDEQLATSVPFLFTGGQMTSAAQIAEMILLGHPQGHLESMNAAQ